MDVKHLSGIALFERLSKAQLAEVAKQADEIDVDGGKRLVSGGRFGYELFIIENGNAEVVRGEEHIADLGPGDFLGEMALLGYSIRNEDMVTSTRITPLVLAGSAF